MKLRIPIDFLQWPELMHMRRVMHKSDDQIVLAIFKLFSWLGYMSMVDEVGFIPNSYVTSMWKIIGRDWFRNFCDAKFVVKDGNKGGYWCPRFRLDHMHLDLAYSTAAEAKNLSRKHFVRMRNEEKRSAAIAAKMHEHIVGAVVPEAKGPQDESLLRRATWLICAIDSALGLPPRPLSHFSGGLINNANTIVKNTPDPQLQLVVATLVKYRRSPKIPNVTELVLLNWGEVVNVVLGGNIYVRVQNLREAEHKAVL